MPILEVPRIHVLGHVTVLSACAKEVGCPDMRQPDGDACKCPEPMVEEGDRCVRPPAAEPTGITFSTTTHDAGGISEGPTRTPNKPSIDSADGGQNSPELGPVGTGGSGVPGAMRPEGSSEVPAESGGPGMSQPVGRVGQVPAQTPTAPSGPSTCGNRIVETTEEYDDANENPYDLCVGAGTPCLLRRRLHPRPARRRLRKARQLAGVRGSR